MSLAASCLISIHPALAETPCRCRADGRYFQLGDIACIGGAEQRRLAQCQMVLNNPVWTVIEKSCPNATLVPRLSPRRDQRQKTPSFVLTAG